MLLPMRGLNTPLSDGLSRYVENVARLPRLSDEETEHLCEQMRTLPSHAEAREVRNRLVEGHLHLVVALATASQKPGLELADLIQEGNLALVEAVQQGGDLRVVSLSLCIQNALIRVMTAHQPLILDELPPHEEDRREM